MTTSCYTAKADWNSLCNSTWPWTCNDFSASTSSWVTSGSKHVFGSVHGCMWAHTCVDQHKMLSPPSLFLLRYVLSLFHSLSLAILAGHKVPVIHLSLFPGSVITNMCLHAWNLYVGSGDWTRVLMLEKQALMTELALQPQDYFWLLSLKNINVLVKTDWLLQKLSIHLLFQSIKVFFILSFLLSSLSLFLFSLLYYNTVSGVFMVSSFLEVTLGFEPFLFCDLTSL